MHICPVHHQRDCSPLLNGCTRLTEPHITCPVCGRTSYHPEDIRQGYCGNCHDWTSSTERSQPERSNTKNS